MNTTTRHNIIDRHRATPAAYASIDHFTLDEGTSAEGQVLLDEAGWTPYCLDDENRRVLFVKTPADVNLSDAPFVYSMQFEQAQEAIFIPYNALIDLTTDLSLPNTTFIYSTGRCGSTLMNQILNQVDGVYSLSEPDVFTNIIVPCHELDRRDEMIALLRALTLMLYPVHSTEKITHFAIKFRSMSVQIVELLSLAIPHVKNVFMYREGTSWARSFYGFGIQVGLPPVMPVDEAMHLWKIIAHSPEYMLSFLPENATTINFGQLAAVFWIFHLEHVIKAMDDDIAFILIRYEELNNEREKTLQELFSFCNLPASGIAQAIEGYKQDSQRGTVLEQTENKVILPDDQLDVFLSTLAKHPRINSPAFMF